MKHYFWNIIQRKNILFTQQNVKNKLFHLVLKVQLKVLIHLQPKCDLRHFWKKTTTLFLVTGRLTVCPSSFSDDYHCAHWWSAGRPPTQQEHLDNHHCKENHELWRWDLKSTPLSISDRSYSPPLFVFYPWPPDFLMETMFVFHVCKNLSDQFSSSQLDCNCVSISFAPLV